MKFEKKIVPSDYDGLNLEVEFCMPEGEIKGIIQIVHGMCEHKERYEDFMMFLAERGFGSVINDHRGHGASVRSSEDLGNFYTDDDSAIVEDTRQISEMIKEKYPDVKLYMFAHSMGTLVARNYLKKYDYLLEKLIMCGPPTENFLTEIALLLAQCSEKIRGKEYRNIRLHNMAFRTYARKFGSEYGWLSSDENEVKKYMDDNLCGFVFTNSGFINLFKMLKGAFDKDGWNMENGSLPIFIMAGEKDPVIQSEEKFYNMEKFMKSLGYKNTISRLYKDKRHELLNEKDREGIYLNILDFLIFGYII